jgi:UDP-glucose 4-epimerase
MGFWTGKQVLITGGAGFIGSNLSHKLIELGATTTIIDSFIPEGGAAEENLQEIKERLTLIRQDLGACETLKKVKGFDIIFHLAAQLGHKESVKNPARDLYLNTEVTLKLLEAVRTQNKDAVIIYAGTRNQYGRIIKTPVREEHPLTPVDPNGVSKQAAEDYLFLYGRNYGIKVCSLRLTNIYGPRLHIRTPKQGFVGWFINLALKEDELIVHGGEQERDLLHVDDVINAFILAAEKKEAQGQAINITSGKSITIKEIAQTIIKKAKKGRVRIIPPPEENKKIEIGNFLGDNTKANTLLGWKPSITFEEGIAQTIEFYQQNPHYLEGDEKQ